MTEVNREAGPVCNQQSLSFQTRKFYFPYAARWIFWNFIRTETLIHDMRNGNTFKNGITVDNAVTEVYTELLP